MPASRSVHVVSLQGTGQWGGTRFALDVSLLVELHLEVTLLLNPSSSLHFVRSLWRPLLDGSCIFCI